MGSAKALMAWGKILEEKTEENKEKIFVEFGGNRVSYESFNRTVNSVANGLLAQGVRKGAPVCLMLPNGLEFPVHDLRPHQDRIRRRSPEYPLPGGHPLPRAEQLRGGYAGRR